MTLSIGRASLTNAYSEAGAELTLEAAALEYAANGWRVVPCRPDKRPYTARGFKDATVDPEQIRAWWRSWPNAMIGSPLEGGRFCVDLDRKAGGADGVSSWSDLQSTHGPAPETLTTITPSTGQHLIFRAPESVRSIPLNKIAPGVEVKGEGGYIILPPSRRADGRVYQRIRESIADAPRWLLDLVVPGDRTRDAGSRDIGPLPDWLLALALQDAGKGIPPAQDAAEIEAAQNQIKAALSVISSDDEQTWFRVGAALCSCVRDGTFTEEEGWTLFHKWSSTSSKYDHRECDQKWDHCETQTDITSGTIFYLAREVDPGWRSNLAGNSAAADLVGSFIQTDSKFASGFTPPDYLIDGILQRRFLYSLTAPTGHGKTSIALRLAIHVALGLPLGEKQVDAGEVLFLAGENPDDVCMRWIKLCEEMRLDPNAEHGVYFATAPVNLSNEAIQRMIKTESSNFGPFSLVIVDTSAAYFRGKDENDNVDAFAHAKMLRGLIDVVDGGPTILVPCHPIKNFNRDNLLPRGGGAFLNEVDGNLVCLRTEGTNTVELHWQGKFRGPEFGPIPFRLSPGTSERLKDSKGRPVWTVTAAPISQAEHDEAEDRGRRYKEHLLRAMKEKPRASLTELARQAGWFQRDTVTPDKTSVDRTMKRLQAEKLVKMAAGRWELTKQGRDRVDETAF